MSDERKALIGILLLIAVTVVINLIDPSLLKSCDLMVC